MTHKSFFPRWRFKRVASRSLAVCGATLVGLAGIAAQRCIAQSSTGAVLELANASHPCVFASVSGTSISTALGECSAPTADSASIDHFEVDLRHGSFGAYHTDLVPYNFSAIPLVRSYVSRPTLFADAALGGNQPRAFGLNTNRLLDGMPVVTKTLEAQTIGHYGALTVQEVRSPRGNSILLGYDSRSRIWEADDDRSNVARYFYGSDGMLCYAFDTSGMIRHYLYDGALMTAVEDEHRHVLVRNSYTAGHLSSQQYANGDVYKFAFTWFPNRTAASSVTVTLPDNSTKVVSFAATEPSTLSMQ